MEWSIFGGSHGDILVTKKSVRVFMMPLSLMLNNVMQRNIQHSKVLKTLRRKLNKSFHNICGSPLCIFFFFFRLTILMSFVYLGEKNEWLLFHTK